MNLLTLLGNAAVDDEEFINKFFEDPVGTAESYGLPLTSDEQDFILELTRDPRSKEAKNALFKVTTCPRKPCAIALPKPRPGKPGSGENCDAA